MKDYSLVKHLAKLTGTKLIKSKTMVNCNFPFGEDSYLTMLVFFRKGKSSQVLYELEDVYEVHGKAYKSYEDFLESFAAKCSFLDVEDVDGDKYIGIDVTVNKIAHTASPALTSLTVLMGSLNEFLGTDAECYSEEEWRNIHRDLLAKQKRNYSIGAGLGVLVFAVGIALAVLSDSGLGSAGVLFGILFIFAGIIGAIVCGLLYKFKKHQLKKSIESKKFRA